MTTPQVTYQIDSSITPKQFIDVLSNSGLGSRRPLANYYVIKGMLDNAEPSKDPRPIPLLIWIKVALSVRPSDIMAMHRLF